MATSFSELKKSRGNFDKLREQVQSLGKKTFEKDETYWQPTVDKAGNGFAIIRFLPPPEGEDLAFVQLYSYGFKKIKNGRAAWFIENAPSTIGLPDPVYELNSRLWDEGTEESKRQASAQKRKLHYIANILVVRDPGNPENEGKVFRYKFGKKIFDKINDKISPQFEGEEGFNPFDPWEGANFKLKIRNVDEQRNYDTSEFAAQSVIGDDDEIEAIWKQEHSLQAILDPKNFKSYDELKKRLDWILSASNSNQRGNTDSETDDETADDVGTEEAKPSLSSKMERLKESKPEVEVPEKAKPKPVETDEGEDDSFSYFQNLADED